MFLSAFKTYNIWHCSGAGKPRSEYYLALEGHTELVCVCKKCRPTEIDVANVFADEIQDAAHSTLIEASSQYMYLLSDAFWYIQYSCNVYITHCDCPILIEYILYIFG